MRSRKMFFEYILAGILFFNTDCKSTEKNQMNSHDNALYIPYRIYKVERVLPYSLFVDNADGYTSIEEIIAEATKHNENDQLEHSLSEDLVNFSQHIKKCLKEGKFVQSEGSFSPHEGIGRVSTTSISTAIKEKVIEIEFYDHPFAKLTTRLLKDFSYAALCTCDAGRTRQIVRFYPYTGKEVVEDKADE